MVGVPGRRVNLAGVLERVWRASGLRYGPPPLTVNRRRGALPNRFNSGWALIDRQTGGCIRIHVSVFPQWRIARIAAVLTHEVAHALVATVDPGEACHGPSFASAFRMLARRCWGARIGKAGQAGDEELAAWIARTRPSMARRCGAPKRK